MFFISLSVKALTISDFCCCPLMVCWFFLKKQLLCQSSKKFPQKIYIEGKKIRKWHLKLVLVVNTVEIFPFLDYLFVKQLFLPNPLSN